MPVPLSVLIGGIILFAPCAVTLPTEVATSEVETLVKVADDSSDSGVDLAPEQTDLQMGSQVYSCANGLQVQVTQVATRVDGAGQERGMGRWGPAYGREATGPLGFGANMGSKSGRVKQCACKAASFGSSKWKYFQFFSGGDHGWCNANTQMPVVKPNLSADRIAYRITAWSTDYCGSGSCGSSHTINCGGSGSAIVKLIRTGSNQGPGREKTLYSGSSASLTTCVCSAMNQGYPELLIHMMHWCNGVDQSTGSPLASQERLAYSITRVPPTSSPTLFLEAAFPDEVLANGKTFEMDAVDGCPCPGDTSHGKPLTGPVSTCANTCLSTPSCTGIFWNFNTEQCWLRDSGANSFSGHTFCPSEVAICSQYCHGKYCPWEVLS